MPSVQATERPLDLFKAIFEADEDEEEDERDKGERAADVPSPPTREAMGGIQEVVASGPGGGAAGSADATGATTAPSVGPAKALADALLKAQVKVERKTQALICCCCF